MDLSKRQPAIVANWKMYKTIGETIAYIGELSSKVSKTKSEVMLAIPFTSLKSASDAAQNTPIIVGAQNMFDLPEGAYTGEISGKQIVDAGAKFVILGHSERRRYFHETNEQINLKLRLAFDLKLKTILCIGESLEEHEGGKSKEVVEFQLRKCLDILSEEQVSQILIAYEPIWAIGTSKAATPEIAQEIHHYCREVIRGNYGPATADKVRILYGGSVKPDNALQLMEQKDIDGLLVGGASLKVETFSEIVNF